MVKEPSRARVGQVVKGQIMRQKACQPPGVVLGEGHCVFCALPAGVYDLDLNW